MEFSEDNISRFRISFQNQEKHQEDVAVAFDEEVVASHQLVVYNDEVNSFDYVIITLMEVCEHSPEQAEQCTLQIHFRGRCGVKSGDFDELVSMRNEICRRGISAEIESYQ
ncbi:ATP-dependent Clp protease adaptor ClpS [Aquirufa nivalisilvae]|jgi:ATP-dependent Clp protease adaptor protein ClpS|uniref:ATP-dependent Clp protease adaptor ClpS n=1 Tax=Aquirufa nivalisilvae TaxID=2516557 RepID=UPI0022A8FF11|nr:ATP-dependent Clp protease adaptor ClpS [Aquirufa nivalisilvae]MCZ2481227.1 ATP-dependent Clp protease adaptor ClpS [Aquirufa nivalisilvae]MCZ2483888.1 ATP-dependent Clp protease adaptor ClpS [Aquirufa nivalisilvae]